MKSRIGTNLCTKLSIQFSVRIKRSSEKFPFFIIAIVPFAMVIADNANPTWMHAFYCKVCSVTLCYRYGLNYINLCSMPVVSCKYAYNLTAIPTGGWFGRKGSSSYWHSWARRVEWTASKPIDWHKWHVINIDNMIMQSALGTIVNKTIWYSAIFFDRHRGAAVSTTGRPIKRMILLAAGVWHN